MTKFNEVIQTLIELIKKYPGLTAKDYARQMRENGYEIFKSDLNSSYLYNLKELFEFKKDSYGVPHWFIKANAINENQIIKSTSVIKPIVENSGFLFLNGNKLWDWQVEALRNWVSNDYRGVVEAITGSGKTIVALKAIEEHKNKGWKILVVVTNKLLQNQWKDEILKNNLFKPSEIGELGDGKFADFNQYNLIIAIVNSAVKNELNIPKNSKGLIIADECHHYEAPDWNKALKSHFEHRLGLTATYTLDDEKTNEKLDDYFEGVIYSLDFSEALNKYNVISPFKIDFIEIELDIDEIEEYSNVNSEIQNIYSKLMKDYDHDVDGDFIMYVGKLAKNQKHYLKKSARRYLKLRNDRRSIVIESKNRVNAIYALLDDIRITNKTFIFTETVPMTERIDGIMFNNGINSVCIHSKMSKDERIVILKKFSLKDTKVMIAPKILDEGVNVPSADRAIVYASTKSRRQMIQRIGRVVRKDKNNPNKVAKISILYCKDTYEDINTENYQPTYLDTVLEAIGKENIGYYTLS